MVSKVVFYFEQQAIQKIAPVVNGAIVLEKFKVDGDDFYTCAVMHYIRKLGVTSVSSFDEIENLKSSVEKIMNNDGLIPPKVRDGTLKNTSVL